MSSVELLDLPDHILAKILSYIPDHFVVASVCQKFYELDCHNHRNLEMRFDFSEHPDELVFDSIQTTNRVFHSMNIKFDLKSIEEFKLLKKILQQHGSTVKELKIEEVYDQDRSKFQLPAKELIEILKFFPVLEKLDISLKCTRIIDEGAESSDKSPFLPKLKELAFSSNLIKFFTKHLPENVKIVVENYYYTSNEESLKNLLKVLETRNLEKIRLNNDFNEPSKWSFFTEFLKTQPNLKSLGIVSDYWSMESDYQDEIDFFNEVVKMKNLEHLTIGEISRAFMEKFPKMNLKSLEICPSNTHPQDFDDVPILTSATLEKLVLPFSYDSDYFQLNFPLRFLKFESFNKKINEVLKEFPLLESLEIKEQEEYIRYDFTIYYADGQAYENLKHLSVFTTGPVICHHNFMKMLKALPNLEKLHFVRVMVEFEQKNFFVDLKSNLPKIQEMFLNLTIAGKFFFERFSFVCLDCHSSSYEEFSKNESVAKFSMSEDSIKALQEFSADEKLVSFECQIEESSNKFRKESQALQGYFRCSVGCGSLTLKKGKAMKIKVPDFYCEF